MNTKFFTQITGILTVIALTQCTSQLEDTDKIELKTRMDTISYIIGLDYGIGIKDEKIDAKELMVYKGLVDGLNGESILSDSVKNKIVDEFNEELKAKIEEEGKPIDLIDGQGITFNLWEKSFCKFNLGNREWPSKGRRMKDSVII